MLLSIFFETGVQDLNLERNSDKLDSCLYTTTEHKGKLVSPGGLVPHLHPESFRNAPAVVLGPTLPSRPRSVLFLTPCSTTPVLHRPSPHLTSYLALPPLSRVLPERPIVVIIFFWSRPCTGDAELRQIGNVPLQLIIRTKLNTRPSTRDDGGGQTDSFDESGSGSYPVLGDPTPVVPCTVFPPSNPKFRVESGTTDPLGPFNVLERFKVPRGHSQSSWTPFSHRGTYVRRLPQL